MKLHLFPKYLQVLLKQRLANHTDLNLNASKTGTKFLFDNVHLSSNVSIYIDTFASNISPYTAKVIGLLRGFLGFFEMKDSRSSELSVNTQTWKER